MEYYLNFNVSLYSCNAALLLFLTCNETYCALNASTIDFSNQVYTMQKVTFRVNIRLVHGGLNLTEIVLTGLCHKLLGNPESSVRSHNGQGCYMPMWRIFRVFFPIIHQWTINILFNITSNTSYAPTYFSHFSQYVTDNFPVEIFGYERELRPRKSMVKVCIKTFKIRIGQSDAEW